MRRYTIRCLKHNSETPSRSSKTFDNKPLEKSLPDKSLKKDKSVLCLNGHILQTI